MLLMYFIFFTARRNENFVVKIRSVPPATVCKTNLHVLGDGGGHRPLEYKQKATHISENARIPSTLTNEKQQPAGFTISMFA